MKKLGYVIAALVLPTMHVQAEIPACTNTAAAEFGVPPKVFEALAIDSDINPVNSDILHGPMGLHSMIIPIAAEGLGVDPEQVRTDECQNYRASAWLLMNPAGGNNGDIWGAVTVYFYGKSTRTRFPMVERVRAIHEKLTEDHG